MDLQLPTLPYIAGDSINPAGSRLTTFYVCVPTVLLAQIRTHRILKNHDSDLSVNANSDRAIPIKQKLMRVKNCPYIPIPTTHASGMSGVENIDKGLAQELQSKYLEPLPNIIKVCEDLLSLGASKQFTNRLLYPWSWSDVILTGDNTGWSHFFNLRTEVDVEPNLRYIAKIMKQLYVSNTPIPLDFGEWHIPFNPNSGNIITDLKVSGSKCARISYGKIEEEPVEKHCERFDKAVNALHVSITEHQAQVPYEGETYMSANIAGWKLLRKVIESGQFTTT